MALMLVLAACSWLPLPATIDLKARLGSQASGTVHEEIGQGEAGSVNFNHPTDEGECIDLSDADIPVTVESARLHYNAELNYDGPELSGRLTAQLYASPSADDLWLAKNRVGPAVNLNLGNTETKLVGNAVLNTDQVSAINERWLCWGLKVNGKDVTAPESGEARIDYTVNDLRLSIRFSVI